MEALNEVANTEAQYSELAPNPVGRIAHTSTCIYATWTEILHAFSTSGTDLGLRRLPLSQEI